MGNQHLNIYDVRNLIEGLLKGDRLCLARLISLVEDVSPHIKTVFRGIAASTGNAYFVGITGPPGAGKSTLINILGFIDRGYQWRSFIGGQDQDGRPFLGFGGICAEHG